MHENTVKLSDFGTRTTNTSTFLREIPARVVLNYILCCIKFSAGLASCSCAVPHHRAPASFYYTKKSQCFQNFNYPHTRLAPQSPFFLADYCYMTQGMAADGLLPLSTPAGTNRAHECHYPLLSKDPYVTLGQIQILWTDIFISGLDANSKRKGLGFGVTLFSFSGLG